MSARPGLFGEVVRRRSVGSFTLTEAWYAPRSEVPQHTHSQAYLTLVLEGGYTEVCGTRTRSCAASTVILHAPGEVHVDRFAATGGRCFTLEFTPAWMRRIREIARGLDESVQCDGGAAAAVAMTLHRELYAADELSSIAVEGLTLELLATIGRTAVSPSRRPWVAEARMLLQARFSEPISLVDTAQTLGIHPVHLARTFRQTYGCAVGEYVRQLRVQYACRQLVETTAALTEIALGAGYSHQSHFTTAFRRATGMTPGEYRKRAKRNGL